MSYEVTATRRRPKNFSTMLGQEFIASALGNSLQNNRIAHAYLFAGPRGVGKTSSARILAKALNCAKGPTTTPCETCSNCLAITKGSSLDVIEIDGASNTGVGDVREIKDEVLFPPNDSRYKIYIIDEVHMLSLSAFNALLKTIEEPPAYVIFIFATTEIHKVPATIRSRCQQYNFRLIDTNTIKTALEDAAKELNIEADAEALFYLAKEGNGSMRDAYTLFDQAVAFCEGHLTLTKIREKMGLLNLTDLNQLVEWCAQNDRTQALIFLNELLAKGISIEQFVIDLTEYFRNLILLKNHITKESLLGSSAHHFSAVVLEAFSQTQLEHALSNCFSLFRNLKLSVNTQFELEFFICKLCELKNYISQQAILKQIEQLRSGLEQNVEVLEAEPQQISYQHALPPASTVTPSPKIETENAMPVEPEADHHEVVDEIKSPVITAPLTAEALKKPLLALLNQQSPALAALLAKIENWQLQDNNLTFIVHSSYDYDILSNAQASILSNIGSFTLEPIKLTILLEEKSAPVNDEKLTELTLIKEIFQGDIVQ